MPAESETVLARKWAAGLIKVYPRGNDNRRLIGWVVLVNGMVCAERDDEASARKFAEIVQRGIEGAIEGALGEGLQVAYDDCVKILDNRANDPATSTWLAHQLRDVAGFFRRLKGMVR